MRHEKTIFEHKYCYCSNPVYFYIFNTNPILVPMGESDEVPFCVIGKCLAEGSIYNEIAHFKGPIRYYTFAYFFWAADLTR